MKGECEGCGGWDEGRPIAGRFFCACCTPKGALTKQWAAVRGLRQRIRDLERQLEEAQGNYEFMVRSAADQKLDGYRELGQRAAEQEARAEQAESQLRRMKDEAKAIHKRWVGEDHARAEGFSLAAERILESVGEKP